MGNLYLGQFFFEDEAPDYDLFDQQADRYGFDKVEYRAALDRVPRWNRERVNIVLTFYRKMADMISRLSFGNLKLAIELSKRKQTEATLNSSLSLLNAAMESTADGILIVDRNGQIVQYNQIFADLWQVPRELLGIYVDDNPVLNHVVQQMAQPEAFLEKVLDLYAHPEASSFDTLNLADGRAFERYSQPQRIGSEIVGRVWSFRDVTERKRAEKALKEAQKGLEKKVQERTTELKKINRLLTLEIEERKNTEAELDNSYQQLRVFNQRWVEIEELERKRLSAELHDEIGQYLTALGINLSIVKMNLPPGADTLLHDRIDESFNLLKRTTAQIKGVMSNLRPTVLDEYGLVPALQWYTEENAKRTGIEIFFTADELPYRPATEIEIALFRIAQEAINNAIKHARANRINMTLNYSENILFLVIVDDGAGFETQAVQDRDDPGWGLMIMRERCLGIRGLFRVESIPGEGTRISAEVPL